MDLVGNLTLIASAHGPAWWRVSRQVGTVFCFQLLALNMAKQWEILHVIESRRLACTNIADEPTPILRN